ncbi:MAG: YcaO-like family protein [Acidimicrobiia bacterium]
MNPSEVAWDLDDRLAPTSRWRVPDKVLTRGTHRTRSLEETLALILPHLERFGITRVADITGLDHVGIPVVHVVQPIAKTLSVASGKGLDLDAARVSGIMEAIEVACVETAPEVVVWGAGEGVAREAAVLHAWGLPVAAGSRYRRDVDIPWVLGTDLASGDPLYVPAEAVHLDFVVSKRSVGSSSPFRQTTNGLASGNTLDEALLHGLCELVERDCGGRAQRLAGHRDRRRRLDLESVHDDAAAGLLSRLQDARMAVVVWDITGPSGLPCFSCKIADPNDVPGRFQFPVAEGEGCHPDRSVALCRALTEAAQSRAAAISGAREDTEAIRSGRPDTPGLYESVLRAAREGGRRDYRSITSVSSGSVGEDLMLAVQRVQSSGVSQLAFVDLSPPDVPISVARVLAPGLLLAGHRRRTSRTRTGGVNARPRGGRARPPVVFLGPTLPREEARQILAADYRPPVQAGDVLYALEEGPPPAIGIIDGRLGDVPSVWHKEILLALEHGVPVLGAASMGALRAAELHTLGMIGIGRIFELYRDGTLTSDDEVTVTHADSEHGFAPRSEALVDMRDDCESAVEHGVIPASSAELFLECAKGLYFPDRTWPLVLRLGREAGVCVEALQAMATFTAGRGPGLKQRDAVTLLRRLARGDFEAPGTATSVPRTAYLERARHEARLSIAAARHPSGTAREEVLDAAEEQALLRVLARRVAANLDLQPTAYDLALARRQLLAEHAIDGAERATGRAQPGVCAEVVEELVRDAALLALLRTRLELEIAAVLPDELGLGADPTAVRGCRTAEA